MTANLKRLFFSLALCFVVHAFSLPVMAETISLGVTHSEYLPAVPDLSAQVAVPDHYRKNSLQGRTAITEPTPLNLEAKRSLQLAPMPPAVPASASPSAVRASVEAPTVERPIVEWFPIPAGMAGVWNKRGDLTVSVTDLRSGISQPINQWLDDEMTVTWGHQTDKMGNVWHANLLPAERDSMSAGKAVRFLTVSQKLENSSASALVSRTHYIVSERWGANGPVADVFQQEALNHYQVLGQSQLQNKSTNRVFSYQGQALRDGALVTDFTRVGQFTPIQTLSGIDLAQSLNDYLHKIGRNDLAR